MHPFRGVSLPRVSTPITHQANQKVIRQVLSLAQKDRPPPTKPPPLRLPQPHAPLRRSRPHHPRHRTRHPPLRLLSTANHRALPTLSTSLRPPPPPHLLRRQSQLLPRHPSPLGTAGSRLRHRLRRRTRARPQSPQARPQKSSLLRRRQTTLGDR